MFPRYNEIPEPFALRARECTITASSIRRIDSSARSLPPKPEARQYAGLTFDVRHGPRSFKLFACVFGENGILFTCLFHGLVRKHSWPCTRSLLNEVRFMRQLQQLFADYLSIWNLCSISCCNATRYDLGCAAVEGSMLAFLLANTA